MFGGYIKAGRVSDITSYLSSEENPMIFAGGTDLMVKSRGNTRYAKSKFIDISAVPELNYISKEEEVIAVGAGVTLTKLIGNQLAAESVPILVRAAGMVGSLQIRNRATLVGNAANACPAADGITALMVLEAEAVICGPAGERTVPLTELYRECKACLRHEGMHVRTCYFMDPTTKKLFMEKGEWIRELRIPVQAKGEDWLYHKLTINRCIELAALNTAMRLKDLGDGRVQALAAVGGMFPRPELLAGEMAVFRRDDPPDVVSQRISECTASWGKRMLPLEKQLTGYKYKRRCALYYLEAGLRHLLLGEEMIDLNV